MHKTKQQAVKNGSKTAGRKQQQSKSLGAAGQGRKPVQIPWHQYIEVKREWLSIMNLLPGDAIGLDLDAKPKPGNFVILDTGIHPYIVQLRKETRTHYHCTSFRLNPECSYQKKYVRSIHVINMMSFQVRDSHEDALRGGSPSRK